VPKTVPVVQVIHPWVLHLSSRSQEWEAVCGEPEPRMLVDWVPSKPLVGYRLCPKCLMV
jgi:hypothetical protein